MKTVESLRLSTRIAAKNQGCYYSVRAANALEGTHEWIWLPSLPMIRGRHLHEMAAIATSSMSNVSRPISSQDICVASIGAIGKPSFKVSRIEEIPKADFLL